MSVPTTVQWLRAAVSRVAIGSGRRADQVASGVVRRVSRAYDRASGWVREASGFAMLFRLGLLVAAAALLRRMAVAVGGAVCRHLEDGSRLLWVAALWWIVAAYRAGADGWEPKAQVSAQPEASADEVEAAASEAADEPAATVKSEPPAPPFSDVALVAAVRDIGTPNAQLVPLAEHLATTTDAVRAAAARLGWPVKDVRQTGRSASAGLRWDEAPTPPPIAPSPAPSSGVVGAGQETDDNDDDVQAVLVRDPANPRRTTVEWRHTG